MQLVLNHLSRAMRWALLFAVISREAGAVAIDGADSHQLRRSSPVEAGVHGAGAVVDKAKHAIIPGSGLPGAEEEKKKKHDKKVMDAISQFRAEICSDMKKEHGEEFSSFEACEKFMKKTCHPGKDEKMDGDRKEVTSEKGFCTQYFPQARKKAEEIVTKEEEEELSHMASPFPGPAPGPAPAPAPAPKQEAPAPAPAAKGPGPAPAPGPMGVPGPAPGPVPAPFIPGVSHGKPYGTIKDDESYYYKKGGKHDDRLHMDEKMKLPAQGYWGKLVEHEDMKTSVEDWGHEFGPTAGHANIEEICAHHPENPWCYEQGFHRHHRSSCPAAAVHVLSFVCAVFAIRVF